MAQTREYRIDSVERSIAVLEFLATLADASVGEVAEALGCPKGSAFRHLRVLESAGLVRQTIDTKRFTLGPRLIYLGYVARAGLELAEVAAPYLAQVRDQFNETTHLGVLSGNEVVHVASALSSHPVKMATEIGDRTGAHDSALGKAMLAFSSADTVADIVATRGLPRFTEHTIVDADRLNAELNDIRVSGYAVDDEESSIGLRCVAAPIFDGSSAVIGAISVSSPASRLPRGEVPQVGAALIDVTRQVSRRFGWRQRSSSA